MLLDKTDREWIENKYHRTDEPFDPLNRMAYHGIGYAEETGMDDEEILTGLKLMQPSLSTMPHPVARAMAIFRHYGACPCVRQGRLLQWVEIQ